MIILLACADMHIIRALGAVGHLFTLLDLTQIAAQQLNAAGEVKRNWLGRHPRSWSRYNQFRQCCIEHGMIPLAMFSKAMTAFVPPDRMRRWLYDLAIDITWTANRPAEHGGSSEDTAFASVPLDAGQVGTAPLPADPVERRNVLDALRRRLEALYDDSLGTGLSYETGPLLVDTCLSLAILCRDELVVPQDALVYLSKAEFYFGLLTSLGVPEDARQATGVRLREASAKTLISINRPPPDEPPPPDENERLFLEDLRMRRAILRESVRAVDALEMQLLDWDTMQFIDPDE